MGVIRFCCPYCDRSLFSLQAGKRGRCPQCRSRVVAPLGLPVQWVDGLGRIYYERDWLPGEAERSLNEFQGGSMATEDSNVTADRASQCHDPDIKVELRDIKSLLDHL